jgi:hypothetical protein
MDPEFKEYDFGKIWGISDCKVHTKSLGSIAIRRQGVGSIDIETTGP